MQSNSPISLFHQVIYIKTLRVTQNEKKLIKNEFCAHASLSLINWKKKN